MTELAFCTATALLQRLDRDAISSLELLDDFLARQADFGAEINALVTLDVDRARERAKAADAARARGNSWGPLHGLPMTVKDCFETRGLRTTAGAEAHAAHVPTGNADAVDRLESAGAVIFAKSNTPTYAMDWQTYNPLHGTTNNPWDRTRTPGGSSGGSAAAVAAGLSALELGSDIGGSIRIPSHCCGVFGHKPSWGIVPQRGHIPGLPGSRVETDLNVIGPLARGPEDLSLALRVLAGPDPRSARAWRLDLPAPRRASLPEYRVAAWLDDPLCRVDPEVRACHERVVERLRKAGAQIDDRARPSCTLGDMLRVYLRLLAPTMAQVMDDDQFRNLEQSLRSAPSGDAGGLGSFLRDIGIRHRDWLVTHQERLQMRAAWDAFFEDYDVLLCPVSPLPAIEHQTDAPISERTLSIGGEQRSYLEQFTWMGPFGAMGLPASVAPAGRTTGGLPVGIQIVGPHLEDLTPIAFAAALARECGGFEPPPAYRDREGATRAKVR